MVQKTAQLFTAAEFFDWCQRPENRSRHFELDRGRIVEVSRPGERHGAVCNNVARILGNFTFQRRKGYACCNDTGLILDHDPDTVKGPDVILYDRSRRYDELNPKYEEAPPDLAVEVLSPKDKMSRVLQRINQLLRRGVRLVWLLDPEDRNVTIFRSGELPQLVEADEEVTGAEVFPDLRCLVADFFALPEEAGPSPVV